MSTRELLWLVFTFLPMLFVLAGGVLLLATHRWSFFVVGVVAALTVLTIAALLERAATYLATVVSASWVVIAVATGVVGLAGAQPWLLALAALFILISVGVLWTQRAGRLTTA